MLNSLNCDGQQLFRGLRGSPRDDCETALATFPPPNSNASREMVSFIMFMWRNAARFIDIAGEATRRLCKARRDARLQAIVATAWATIGSFDPLQQSPGQWFRDVVMRSAK